MQATFHATREQRIKFDVLLGNYTGKPQSFAVIAIVDYSVVATAAGSQARELGRVELDHSETERLHFDLGTLDRGAHDLVLLAFDADHCTDSSCSADDSFPLVAHRTSVLIDSLVAYPSPPQTALDQVRVEAQLPAIVLSRRPKIYDPEAGQTLDLANAETSRTVFAHLSNSRDGATSYALILFEGAKVAQVLSDASIASVFFTLKGWHAGSVRFDLSDSAGESRLWGLLVENPYVTLEQPHGTYREIATIVSASRLTGSL